MNILKAIIKGTFTIIILGLITMKSLEWALYFFVAKPVAKEIAYDVTSYVEVNDRYFTEESLNEYLDAYRKKDLNIKVLYNQHPDDKRFIVKWMYRQTGTVSIPQLLISIPAASILEILHHGQYLHDLITKQRYPRKQTSKLQRTKINKLISPLLQSLIRLRHPGLPSPIKTLKH